MPVQAQVPKLVLEAVTRKYPPAKLNAFEQEMSEGKLIYEEEKRPKDND